jgi:peptidoglycan/LPS O-acetylase OafA/YrhL
VPEIPGAASPRADAWRTRARRWFLGRTLAECIQSGRDNILLLRLIAALLVVVGHSFPLARPASWPDDPMLRVFPHTPSHLVGLMTFFIVSGFLITLSFQRQPHLPRFLRARFLRIWPALAVCVVAWAFVLGPLVSGLPPPAYFATGQGDAGPYGYAWGNLTFRAFNVLPGVFVANPIPAMVNSPLWTIAVEAKLYLCVALVGVLRLLQFRWVVSAAIVALFVALFAFVVAQSPFVLTDHLMLVVQGFFGAGAIACLLRERIPISSGLMASIALACLLARDTPLEIPAIWLAVGYFALWFSYVPSLPSLPRKIDLSYGTYLWAWPIQQTLVSYGVRDPVALIAIAAPVVLAIASASWLLIEAPALRLKDGRRNRSATSPNPAVERA